MTGEDLYELADDLLDFSYEKKADGHYVQMLGRLIILPSHLDEKSVAEDCALLLVGAYEALKERLKQEISENIYGVEGALH